MRAVAPGEVEHEFEAVHEDVPLEFGNDVLGRHLKFLWRRLFGGSLAGLIGCLHSWVRHWQNPGANLASWAAGFKTNGANRRNTEASCLESQSAWV